MYSIFLGPQLSGTPFLGKEPHKEGYLRDPTCLMSSSPQDYKKAQLAMQVRLKEAGALEHC